ncbi:MAG: hypothetical protein ACFFBD_18540, partial [Candidatus Hodarchaeota archaeon]
MNQQKSWNIRSYQPGDERELVTLFHRAFGYSITEAHWCWKFKQLPSQVENVWVAVLDNNKPIFQFANIPYQYQLPIGRKSKKVLGMYCADAMTD